MGEQMHLSILLRVLARDREVQGGAANVNHPMPPGTDYASWRERFGDAIERVEAGRGIEARRGVQAGRAGSVARGGHVQDDPSGFFLLGHDDYSDMGRRIAGLGLPSMVVMEGGYAVDDLGINTANFIEALAQG